MTTTDHSISTLVGGLHCHRSFEGSVLRNHRATQHDVGLVGATGPEVPGEVRGQACDLPAYSVLYYYIKVHYIILYYIILYYIITV